MSEQFRYRQSGRLAELNRITSKDFFVKGTDSFVNEAVIKTASNILTRLFTHIQQAFNFSDKERWIKLSMLRAAARLNEDVKELQELILSNSPMDALKLMNKSVAFATSVQIDIFKKFERNLDPIIEELRQTVRLLKRELEKVKQQDRIRIKEERSAARNEKDLARVRKVENNNRGKLPETSLEDLEGLGEITENDDNKNYAQMIKVVDDTFRRGELFIRALNSANKIKEVKYANAAIATFDILKKQRERIYSALKAQNKPRMEVIFQAYLKHYKDLEAFRNIITANQEYAPLDVKPAGVITPVQSDKGPAASNTPVVRAPEKLPIIPEDSLNATAGFLGRVTKRIKTNLFGGDDKTFRLEADKNADEVRTQLKNLMNVLEDSSTSVWSLMSNLSSLANSLDNFYFGIGKILNYYQSYSAYQDVQNKSVKNKEYVPRISSELKNEVFRSSTYMKGFAKKLTEYNTLLETITELKEKIKMISDSEDSSSEEEDDLISEEYDEE